MIGASLDQLKKRFHESSGLVLNFMGTEGR
jgi:hypothetical protein